MASPLSPSRLRTARRGFNIFNFFNSASFVLVSGSFLTLLAIRMGASNAVVGILNAIAYSTFFMIVQYAAAALVSENKVLAHPASVDSIPSSANQEDHVSMGTIAARKAASIIENAQRVVAMIGAYAAYGAFFLFNSFFGGKSGVLAFAVLVASMLAGGGIALLANRFAYRPLRYKPKLSALITAIGVSMHSCLYRSP